MVLTPDAPFPKTEGDDIRAQDWNDVVQEVQRLENNKLDKTGQDWNDVVQEVQRLKDNKLNKTGGDVDGPLRFNKNENQRVYGAVRNGQNTVVLDGHWDELEVKGRVLDWTGSNFHIGYTNDHTAHGIYIGMKVGQTVFYSGGGTAETMRLQSGEVGIGTSNPATKLHVVGNRIRLQKPGSSQTLDLRADGGALDLQSTGGDLYLNNNNVPVRIRNLVQGSSRAWKEDLTVLSTEEASGILEHLQPTSFTFKEDTSHQRHLGFVAEEVHDSVATPEKTGYSPTAIIAVLTQVVKEQQQQLARLQEDMAALQQRLTLLANSSMSIA